MKLADTHNNIEQINVTNETQFKMKSSRKAFQILSDLYSDKPLAIVRELGCNAFDSHTAAGKADQPFHIHLPNTLEPWITIQDFGTGISPDNIYSIYSTYFESTKTQTNDQIGCLGLGSKSPFCYSDNFVVTSIFDGEKSIYNAYFNQDNTPAIALMSRTSTTEGNGISIQIPVKNTDFHLFKNAVQKAFRFFPVKPTISGGEVDWNCGKVLFAGSNWDVYDREEDFSSYAIMGGVAYPIDYYKVDVDHRRLVSSGNLVMKFEMGELEFTPSREALSYTPMTIDALNKKLSVVKDEFKSKIKDVVDEKPNVFEAIMTVHKFRDSHWSNSIGINFDKITWRGNDISNPWDLINKLCNSNPMMTYSRKRYRRGITESRTINLTSKWFFDDVNRGAVARIKYYLKNNNDSIESVTVFSMDAYKALVENADPLMRFDASSFTALSTLSRVPSTGRTYTKGVTNAVVDKSVFSIYRYGNRSHTAWEAEEFDPANPPKYYIVKEDGAGKWMREMKVNNQDRIINDKEDLMNLIRCFGINIGDVAMVSSKKVNRIESVSTNLIDHINSLDPFMDVSGDDVATFNWMNQGLVKDIFNRPEFKKLDASHPFAEYISKCYASYEKMTKYYYMRSSISHAKDGKPHKINSDCPIMNLLAARIETYNNWEVKDFFVILNNLKV